MGEKKNLLLYIAGLAILAVALGLRWPQLHDSLWLDELHTAWCVSGTWQEVAPRATFGNQSPCYFYLLRAVVGACGMNEYSLRLPSLLAGVGLLAVTGFAITRWTGSLATGFFAAGLVALDRNCVFYSQEARPYAMLQLVAWCHVLVVWQLSRQANITTRVLFIGGAILQFYLHYTAALFIAAEVLFLLVNLRQHSGGNAYRWSQLTLDLTIIGAAFLPVAQQLLAIGSRRGLWEQFVRSPSVLDFWYTLRLDTYLVPCLAMLAAMKWMKKIEPIDWQLVDLRRAQALIAGALIVPAGIAWLTTRWHIAALFLGRYLVSSLVAAPMATALLLGNVPAISLRRAAAGLTIVMSIWTAGFWQQWRQDGRMLGDRHQDWRGAVAFVNQTATSENSVAYVRSGFVEASGLGTAHESLLEEYCLAPVNSLYRLQIPSVPLSAEATAKIDPAWIQRGASASRWFLINGSPATRQRFLKDMERQARDLGLATPFARVQEFGDVLVCELAKQS